MVGVAAVALVAHVSVLQGRALIERASGGTIVATRNDPVLAGDTFSTTQGSQAEIALGASLVVRLDGSSAVQIVSLAPHHRDIRLLGGTITVSAQANADSPRIDTPSVVLAPDAPGLFDVSRIGGETNILAHRGTIRIVTPNGMQVLAPGELVSVEGSASAPELSYATAPPNDAFYAFNETREAAIVAAANTPHLPPGLQRTTDLSAYGSWIELARYGAAWKPQEPPGWAPYMQGRWLWRGALGWTWIPHEPWGWIPYHYGAWTYDPGHGWLWIPPASSSLPAWSNANAVFFSEIVRGRTRSVGWIALAPGEPFHSIASEYQNAGAPGGMHAIDVHHFYSGDFSGVLTVSPASLPAGTRLRAPPPPRLYQSAPSARMM